MNRNITATILIVLAAALYLTYTSKVWAEAKAVKATNDQYSSALDSAAKLIGLRDQVLNSYKNISAEDQDHIDKMLPNTVDNIRLVIDLNSIALQHGFSLKNITATTKQAATATVAPGSRPATLASMNAPKLSISAPTLDTVSVSFSVSAPYLQFISFMQDLEASLRVMDITHLTVTANETGIYDFNVQISTYWLRQQ